MKTKNLESSQNRLNQEPSPKKLAILVGHNKDSQGATTQEGITEWQYNHYVAVSMQYQMSFLRCFDAKVFARRAVFRENEIREAYQRINKWGPDAIIELHFNSYASASANGTEMLYWHDSAKGYALASALLDSVVENFNTKQRGVFAVAAKIQRGYRNLTSGAAPTVICKPFFGSHSERAEFISQPDKLANAYVAGVLDYFDNERIKSIDAIIDELFGKTETKNENQQSNILAKQKLD